MKQNKITKKDLLDWIKQEKIILKSLIMHHQANVFALAHFNVYSNSIKDWWNLYKIKRDIKSLDRLETKLKKEKGKR